MGQIGQNGKKELGIIENMFWAKFVQKNIFVAIGRVCCLATAM